VIKRGSYAGNFYAITGRAGRWPMQTLTGDTVEPSDGSFEGHARSAFLSNPVVFRRLALRAHVFSAIVSSGRL
jgi:hypothetical protein